MGEDEWFAGSDPELMLQHVMGAVSDRKLRLFAVACCRRIGDSFTDEGDRAALSVIERFADGLAGAVEFAAVPTRTTNQAIAGAAEIRANAAAAVASAVSAALIAARDGDPDHPKGQGDYYATEASERKVQARILRELFRNPFRTVAFSAEWRTDTTVALARGMYEAREFSAMPILADALQDAGCNHTDVLAHCRGAGAHLRGCWVLDLVLGRA
ncbi:hypothetical protein [Gemmata palustris]|uniref:hypothetical protein n=1 Tax=Gemmata palustris TaxID=2822762 RepID=UPI001FE3A4A1|nr:hypothetical protein [Gemmata palustris]